MSALSHMSLSDRKAYALQAIFQGAVRSVAADAPVAQLRALAENVWSFAQAAFKGEASGDLDKFLADAVVSIEKIIQIRFGQTGVSAETASILEVMQKRVERVRCDKCCNGRICDGKNESDTIIVAAEEGGRCIHEIKQAFDGANILTRAFYYGHAEGGLPDLVLETVGLAQPSSQIPGHNLAVNAITRFGDDPPAKVSRIKVRVAPLSLGRECLASLPYLLLHEVFCHGFQMSAAFGKRANKGDIPDPISEGMMDALAVKVLEEHAAREAQADEIKGEIAQRYFKAARSIHDDRASLDRDPPFPEARIVALGEAVLDAVRALYSQDPPAERVEEDARALACALNLAGWDYATRLKGTSRLLQKLRRPRDPELVKLLLNFRRGRNTALLISHLA